MGVPDVTLFPFETWRYRYIEDIGSDIIIEFVDPTMSGEYRMTVDPSEKDALLHVPGAGLTQYEQMNGSGKTDRFKGGGLEQLGNGPMGSMQQGKERIVKARDGFEDYVSENPFKSIVT